MRTAAMPLIETQRKPHRVMPALLVVVAHVAVGAVLMRTGVIELSAPADPIEVTLIAAPAVTSPPPPPPLSVSLPQSTSNIQAITPDIVLAQAPETTHAITVAAAAMPSAVSAPADAVPVVVRENELSYINVPSIRRSAASKRAGEHGVVVLLLHIDEQGRVRNVQVEQSSSFARLDEAAASAMRSARFQPIQRNGRSCSVKAIVPVEFPA